MTTSTMSSEHACIFCPESFPSLDTLVVHLFLKHREEKVMIGQDRRRFRVYKRTRCDRVLCFCGQRFTCDSASLDVAPFFQDWFVKHIIEIDSYVAHLRRAGGFQEHLEALRREAMLNKIAGTEKGVSFTLSTEHPPDWSFSFLRNAVAEMNLDKMEMPPLE